MASAVADNENHRPLTSRPSIMDENVIHSIKLRRNRGEDRKRHATRQLNRRAVTTSEKQRS